MTMLPPNDEEREGEARGLFADLRAHVVELSAGFGRRLSQRLDEAEERRGPSPTSLLSGFAVQLMNMLSGAFEDEEGRGGDDD